MFERFTERARQVVILAQAEAQALKHNYLGTEHILLGLLREEEGLAARVLQHAGVELDYVRKRVGEIVGAGDEIMVGGQIPFTPRTKRILEGALREALTMGHNFVGTEHILLGLVRDTEGIASLILSELAIEADTLRTAVTHALVGDRAKEPLSETEAAALRIEIIRTAAETLRDAAVILETAAQALTEIPA